MTLQLTVRLGVETLVGLMTIFYFKFVGSGHGASSMTKEWACPLSLISSWSAVTVIYIFTVLEYTFMESTVVFSTFLSYG
jgi:hypothetical protein